MIVYLLSDPQTNEACYIGITDDLKKRVRQHMRHPSWNLKDWRDSLLINYLQPVATVLAEVATEDEARKLEAQLIETYLADGHPLLNKMMGGKHADHHSRLNSAKWVAARNHKVY